MERRPQRLVPRDDVPERALERGHVERAVETQARRDVVDGLTSAEAVERQQATLGKRDRQGSIPANRRNGGAAVIARPVAQQRDDLRLSGAQTFGELGGQGPSRPAHADFGSVERQREPAFREIDEEPLQ